MASEMHCSETISFAPNLRFNKGVSFHVLSEVIPDERQESRVNIATNISTNIATGNVMVTNASQTCQYQQSSANSNCNSNSLAISKSSSSDSDTSSATRLLDCDQDFRSVGYLLLTPGLTNTTSLNDSIAGDASSDALWTQMHNSLSKEIRKRYLIKNRFPHSAIRRDYTFVGLNSYLSTIKLVFSVTLVILLSTIVLLVIVLYLTRRKPIAEDHNVNYVSEQNWWRGTTFYEIFPASFLDSDADGYGDFRGIIDKISYLKDLGIQAVRLNSIFAALDYPHRYDNVLDFYSVDPHLGKLSDFILMVKELRKANIRVILDVSATHTSDQHPWAAHWLLNKSGEYQYFYSGVIDDNNDLDWTSSSATDRLQSVMEESHLSFGGRLFLNWSHPLVARKMLDMFEFWLNHVDGFYLKHLNLLRIDSEQALYSVLERLRNLLNSRETEEKSGSRKILICSSDFVHKSKHTLLSNYMRNPLVTNDPTIASNANTANNNASKIVDILNYFDLIDFQLTIDVNKTETIRDQVNAIFLNAPKTFPWIHWSIGNVATSRLANRIGFQYSITAAFLLIMLPGTISLFYGDEIGLKDSYDILTNKEYRGGQLCPMQWSSNINADFSASNATQPWIPVHPNYTAVNVIKRMEAVHRFNQLTVFRSNNFDLENQGKHGNYLFHYIDDNVIVLERYFDRVNDADTTRFRYVLFANFGTKVKVKDFSDKFHFSRIKISSNPNREKEFLYMRSLRLDPGEAMIVEVE